MPPLKKAAPAPVKGFSLGDMSAYSSGGGLPEGDYCITDFSVQMYQATSQQGISKGPARLGVMITLVPLSGGEERTQFYSMGSNADKSWAPNPETGKGIVPVPGGPGTPPNASTNWAIFVENLYNSGLPQGILDDDLSVLDGIWVHMQNIPEPEGRKAFASAKTGEAADEPRKNGTIAVVSEIKDDGKPWEGGGGVPDPKSSPAAPPVATKRTATASVPLKGAATSAASRSKVVEPEPAETDLQAVAESAMATVLGEAKSMPKLKLKTSTFKAVNDEHGQDIAQAVAEQFFGDDAVLGTLLDGLGYTLAGAMVNKQ